MNCHMPRPSHEQTKPTLKLPITWMFKVVIAGNNYVLLFVCSMMPMGGMMPPMMPGMPGLPPGECKILCADKNSVWAPHVFVRHCFAQRISRKS